MLFYEDPFNSKKFEKVAEWRDDAERERSHIRLMYDRQEKNVILFQEVYCRGHMRNSSVALSAVTAVAMFPNYGSRINELLTEAFDASTIDPWAS